MTTLLETLRKEIIIINCYLLVLLFVLQFFIVNVIGNIILLVGLIYLLVRFINITKFITTFLGGDVNELFKKYE